MWATNRRVRSEEYETWLRDLQNVHQVTEEPMSTFADLIKVTQEYRSAEWQFEEAYKARERLATANRQALEAFVVERMLSPRDVYVYTCDGNFYTLSYQGGWVLSPAEPITVS